MKNLTEDKKTLITAIIGFGFLVVIGFFMLSAIGGTVLNPVNVYFEDSVVNPGNSTVLVVEVRNNGEADASNVNIKVVPESAILFVDKPERVEPVIGAGSYRRVKFDVTILPGATEGNYRVNVNVNMGEDPLTGKAFVEVN